MVSSWTSRSLRSSSLSSRHRSRCPTSRRTLSAYVAHRIGCDSLNELIAVAEAEHGPITDEEIQARRDALLQAR
ncbi:CopG family transcriptional regulator [Protofrankia symbiont of Coriaria ruscifolia]|uniref:CopG family transcriptional regulator n=1 Tax=Protofrankia symbiont of Coriaria ruscifolia TaxID=1306542 RepID=UPI0010411FF8|nr:CopG family transcriptional regulator [Protofrankia symbiont of Coriaria ruscifolia]